VALFSRLQDARVPWQGRSGKGKGGKCSCVWTPPKSSTTTSSSRPCAMTITLGCRRLCCPGRKCSSGRSTTEYLLALYRLAMQLPSTAGVIAAYLSDGCRDGGQISLPEAWRGRQKALEMEFGTYYESYNYVPRILKNLGRLWLPTKSQPGTLYAASFWC
jgi:hypothetical protein